MANAGIAAAAKRAERTGLDHAALARCQRRIARVQFARVIKAVHPRRIIGALQDAEFTVDVGSGERRPKAVPVLNAFFTCLEPNRIAIEDHAMAIGSLGVIH